jgi:hypothetical protein
MSDKPKLVVDNKLLDEDEDFETIAEQILDLHKRYPEIDALLKRARDNNDMAMFMAATTMIGDYGYWRDVVAEVKRRKLRVVRRRKR